MREIEVKLLKRPTIETLIEGSSKVWYPNYLNDKPEEVQSRILERTKNIPFSPYWRGVLEENPDDSYLTVDLASRIFKAANTNNDKNFLKTVAVSLGGHFPDQLLQADIDLTFSPPRLPATKPAEGLSDLLRYARREYKDSIQSTSKQPAISESWINFADALSLRDKERHARIFTEASKAYHEQVGAADAISSSEPYYRNLNPAHEGLRSLAAVLARNFPRTVVSHLRAPRPRPSATRT